MSTSKRLFDQQTGHCRWNFHENILTRFRCTKDEQYTQLVPLDDAICDTPIFACKFAQQDPHKNCIALANEDGKLVIHDTTGLEEDKNHERYGIQAHNNAIFDLAWMFDDMQIVTASGDHTARLFDVSDPDVREIRAFYGHTRSVKAVAFRKHDSSVFATGGRDGNIIIWDTRTDLGSFIGRADRTIHNSHNVVNNKYTPSKSKKKCFCGSNSGISGAKSVTGLAFQDENTLISCGAGDGIIKIWDLRKNYISYKQSAVAKVTIPYSGSTNKNGFSSLIIDKESIKLYANCLDNTIYCYNLNNYSSEPIIKYTGHQNSTFYIKSCLSANGNFLISGSSDEKAYIWSIAKNKPIVSLAGHNAEVTCVAWSEANELTLVTCSDDMSHRIWRVGAENLPENWEIIGRGQAEIYPSSNTPKSKLKRISESPCSDNKKLIMTCDNCNKQSTSYVGHRNLCVICENPTNKRKCLEEISNENAKKFRPSSSRKNLFVTNDSENNEEIELSGLPNFVLDGAAPHLNFSPPKKKMQDWLTRLRIERQLKGEIREGPAMKILKLEPISEGVSKKNERTTQSPILRYFKVKCEGHGTKGLGSNSNVTVASPKSSF